MGKTYELLFYRRVGESAPLDSIEEVKEALFEATGTRFSEVQPGDSFTTGDGEELIVVSSYGTEEEDY